MSLYGEYDVSNIFSKIITGEASCYKVYEDDVTLAFLDLFPQSYGHCLVISKQARARNILDIKAEDFKSVMLTAQKVAQVVAKTFNPDGIVVTQFNGAPAGQTVFHLHVHIIPHYLHNDLKMHAQEQAKAQDLEVAQQKLIQAFARHSTAD